MINFEDWFKDLCSNYVWYEPAKMKHKPETFKAIANAVYMQYVGAEKFPTIQDARVHVYRKVVLTPGDMPKVDWTKVAKKELDYKEAEKAKEDPPLIGEARAKKLAEVKAAIDALPKRWSPPEMTEEEKQREGAEPDEMRARTGFKRSEVETMEVYNQHKMKIDEARRKYFKSAYPDASEEEVQAYLNKFDKI